MDTENNREVGDPGSPAKTMCVCVGMNASICGLENDSWPTNNNLVQITCTYRISLDPTFTLSLSLSICTSPCFSHYLSAWLTGQHHQGLARFIQGLMKKQSDARTGPCIFIWALRKFLRWRSNLVVCSRRPCSSVDEDKVRRTCIRRRSSSMEPVAVLRSQLSVREQFQDGAEDIFLHC